MPRGLPRGSLLGIKIFIDAYFHPNEHSPSRRAGTGNYQVKIFAWSQTLPASSRSAGTATTDPEPFRNTYMGTLTLSEFLSDARNSLPIRGVLESAGPAQRDQSTGPASCWRSLFLSPLWLLTPLLPPGPLPPIVSTSPHRYGNIRNWPDET